MRKISSIPVFALLTCILSAVGLAPMAFADVVDDSTVIPAFNESQGEGPSDDGPKDLPAQFEDSSDGPNGVIADMEDGAGAPLGGSADTIEDTDTDGAPSSDDEDGQSMSAGGDLHAGSVSSMQLGPNLDDPADKDGPQDDSLGDAVQVFDNGTLHRDVNGIYFIYLDGTRAQSELLALGDKTYYFGDDGYAESGMVKVGSKFLLFDDVTFTQLFGWHTWEDGARSFFSPDHNGAAAKGRWEIDGKIYYFDVDTRKTVLGWHSWDDGRRSYFSPKHDGAAAKGRWEIDGKLYYFSLSNRKAISGWHSWSDGTRSYFSSKHGYAAAKGRWEIDGKVYYFNLDTKKSVNGWHRFADGRRSYFSSKYKGAAARGRWEIDGKVYYFDPESRKTVFGWHTWDDGRRSFFSSEHGGAAAKGRWEIDGKVFYFSASNRKTVSGWYTWSDGKRSYFSPKHGDAAAKGWWTIGGKRYFFHRTTRKALTGKWRVGDNRYYFGSNGVMRTGWITWNSGKMSHFASNGVMAVGSRKINGTTFKFDSNGYVTDVVKARMLHKAQGMYSSTNYMIFADVSNNYVGVFKRSGSAWNMHKYWRCSSGALNGHATPTGVYTVGIKGYVFGHGYSCYYYTQFLGDYLFHSVKYYPGTRTIMDGRLGMHISQGCVRLEISNAKWIYDNVPSGSTVKVYRN